MPIDKRQVRGLTTDLRNLNSYVSGRLGIKGLYNIVNGLQAWRNSRGRSRKNAAGTGMGGTDIVCIGSSVTAGAYASSYAFDTWPAILRNRIQDNHNPSGVQGGMGYVPLQIADNTWVHTDTPAAGANQHLWTFDTAGNWTLSSGTGLHAGMRRSYMATNGTGSRVRYVWDGTATNAARDRKQVTDIELVTSNFVGDGTITWDRLTSDAFVAVGAGAATGTINQNAVTDFSIHRGRQASGLTKTSLNGIQVSQAAGTAICRVDGAIAYCEDWDCGYRLHNLGLTGGRSDYPVANVNSTSANFSKWGATAPGGTAAGATQAGLFIVDFILNDVGLSASPTLTLTQFIGFWTSIITAIQACPSRPSILIWIPPCRNNANTFANMMPYVNALYTLADTYNLAIFDMWGMLDYGSFTTKVEPENWDANDGTHYNDTGNAQIADYFYRILMGI